MPNYIIEFCADPTDPKAAWEPNLAGQLFRSKWEANQYIETNCIEDHYWSRNNFRVTPIDEIKVVVDPPHYQKLDPEPIDVIEKWGLNFRLSNVVKYIARHGRKPGNDAASDLRKARNYLNREINAIAGIASWDSK